MEGLLDGRRPRRTDGQRGSGKRAAHNRQSWLNSATDTVKRIHEGRIVETGAKNVPSGPWNDEGNGLYAKRLADGQGLFVTWPPHANAPAWSIPPRSSYPSLSPKGYPPGTSSVGLSPT